MPVVIAVVLTLTAVGVTWWLGTRNLNFLAPPPGIATSPIPPPTPEASPPRNPVEAPPAPAIAPTVPALTGPKHLNLHVEAHSDLAELLDPLVKETATLLTDSSGGALAVTPDLIVRQTTPLAFTPSVAVSLAAADDEARNTGVMTFTPDHPAAGPLRIAMLRTIVKIVANRLADESPPLPAIEAEDDPLATLRNSIPATAWDQFARSFGPGKPP